MSPRPEEGAETGPGLGMRFRRPTAKLGIDQLSTAPFRRALGVVEISVPRPKNRPVTGTLVTIAGPSLRTVISLMMFLPRPTLTTREASLTRMSAEFGTALTTS